ncbi:hypothetical protein WDU94_004521 [Cyamophila willieti]
MKSLSLDSPESTEHAQRRRGVVTASQTIEPHSSQSSSSRVQSPSSPVHNRRLLSARNMRMSSVELPDDNEKSLSSASTSPCPSPVRMKAHRLLPTNLFVVLYNFKSRHADELDLKPGYKVTVIDTSDQNWWKGKCMGRVGYFPSNYVIKVQPGERPLQVTHNLQIADGESGLSLLRDQIVIQIGDEVDGMVMIRNEETEMESTATPVKSNRNNEISINNKHKFETQHNNIGNNAKSKVLKKQISLDVASINSKVDSTYFKNVGPQRTKNHNQQINGILHKTMENNVNYNRVNKGIQANLNKDTEQKRTNGKYIKSSKSFDETAFVNKKTQTSLENISNSSLGNVPTSYSYDTSHHHTRRKNNMNKMEQTIVDYYEHERYKVAEKSMDSKNKKMSLELSREEQQQESMIYQKQMMSAMSKNKSITPTENEDKTLLSNHCDKSVSNKYSTRPDYNTKPDLSTSNYQKDRSYSTKQNQEQTKIYHEETNKHMRKSEPSKMKMKKSYSMYNYSESTIDHCSNKYFNDERTSFRPTTKSFSFDLENKERCETSKQNLGRQDFVKISKPNCDILRKHSKQQQQQQQQHDSTQESKPREIKSVVLHETKVKHPLEAEPIEAIIGQGFADDKHIQTPLILRQMNENDRDYCYWTTRNSRKNSASMISDEAIIGKGFLDDEEFIEFYSTKQPKLQQVPEEMKSSVSADVKKASPKFVLNKNEIKKYFLNHGNNYHIMRTNVKSEQGYNEVPVKPIVKKVVNANDTSCNTREPMHFNLNFEVPGEVQNKDHNNNFNNNEKKQNEYVELGSKPVDHHYEVLQNKYHAMDQLFSEAPLSRLEDDVFVDEKVVKHLGEDYMETNTSKYRKSPMLWYINDQVISFHNDIPSIIANKKISLPVSSNIRPLGFPSSTTSYYSMHNFDMHRANPQSKGAENYTSMIRPLILG